MDIANFIILIIIFQMIWLPPYSKYRAARDVDRARVQRDEG
jgi:hypothetical protein